VSVYLRQTLGIEAHVYVEKPEIHHIGDDPAGPHEEIGIFKMPLGVHFMDEFAVAAIYVDRVV